MPSALTGIRRRLQRLEEQLRLRACSRPHVVRKNLILYPGSPARKWPEEGAPTHCSCGERIQHRCHVVTITVKPPVPIPGR